MSCKQLVNIVQRIIANPEGFVGASKIKLSSIHPTGQPSPYIAFSSKCQEFQKLQDDLGDYGIQVQTYGINDVTHVSVTRYQGHLKILLE